LGDFGAVDQICRIESASGVDLGQSRAMFAALLSGGGLMMR
jgi:hypothetical protein